MKTVSSIFVYGGVRGRIRWNRRIVNILLHWQKASSSEAKPMAQMCFSKREKQTTEKDRFLGGYSFKSNLSSKRVPSIPGLIYINQKNKKKTTTLRDEVHILCSCYNCGGNYLSNAIPTHPLLMLSHEPLAPQQHELKTRVNDLSCSVVVHSGLGSRIIWLWFGIKTEESKCLWYLFRLFWES